MKNKIIEALKKIGWSVDDDPSNRFIRNCKGERTNLQLRSDGIHLEFDNKGMWGKNGRGDLYIGYDNLIIKESIDCVCLMAKDLKGFFVQFYNHKL